MRGGFAIVRRLKLYYNLSMVPRILFAVLLLVASAASAQCPSGQTDDPAPGRCGRYVDADRDGLCDLSQSSASLRDVPEALSPLTFQTKTKAAKTDVKTARTVKKSPFPVKPAYCAFSSETTVSTFTSAVPASRPAHEEEDDADGMVFGVLLISWIAGFIIKRRAPRLSLAVRFGWNVILIVSFIACILPVFYFELPQPLKLIPYAPVIWLHKTAGMAFIIAGLLHLAERLPIFHAQIKNVLGPKKQ